MTDPENPGQPGGCAESIQDDDIKEPAFPSSIHFYRQGTNNHLLVAEVESNQDFPAGLPISRIEGWIRDQGCGDWKIKDESIRELAREIRKLEKRKNYILAEKCESYIEIRISSDRLNAWIRVSPPFGGEALTETALRKALDDHGVRFGIKGDVLQQILQEGSCENITIAEGTPPIDGTAVIFESLVKESEHKGIPQQIDHGKVDYKDLGLFTSVEIGTPLLKRIPPTQGTPGTGVDGNIIAPRPGKDKPLVAGSGTAISKEDPAVLIATKVGQPQCLENSARVDPTLEINGVNPSTGNVFFDGNILVKGPVESGFTVKAGQDLTIFETVEGANLAAGNNIVLLTGVYGKNKSEIIAGGKIEAKFLSDCRVYSGGDVSVSDLISHCHVESEGSLILGKRGGKGQAFGGKLVALHGFDAQVLGSTSESATIVEVAPPKTLLANQARVDSAIEKAKAELGTTSDSSTRAFLERKIEELKEGQEKIAKKMDLYKSAKIKAAHIHGGVHLFMGAINLQVTELMEDVCLQHPPEQAPPK